MTRERGYLLFAGLAILAAILLFFCVLATYPGPPALETPVLKNAEPPVGADTPVPRKNLHDSDAFPPDKEVEPDNTEVADGGNGDARQGELSGCVRDSAGIPVCGATITLSRQDDDTKAQATTIANGRFRLFADAGEYAGQATAVGFLPLELESVVVPGILNIIIESDTNDLTGTVFNSTGDPCEAFTMWFYPRDTSLFLNRGFGGSTLFFGGFTLPGIEAHDIGYVAVHRFENPDGSFCVPSRRGWKYTGKIVSDSGESGSLPWLLGGNEPCNIKLKGSKVINCLVVDEETKVPIEGARIDLAIWPYGFLLTDEDHFTPIFTAADGTFSISSMRSVSIRISHPEYAPEFYWLVTYTKGEVTYRGEYELSRGGSLNVQVFDRHGTPASGAEVGLRVYPDEYVPYASGTTGPDGVVRLERLSPSHCEYYVRVRFPDYPENIHCADVHIEEGHETNLTFGGPGAIIEGVVTVGSIPVAAAHVRLESLDFDWQDPDAERFFRAAATGFDGSYCFTGIPAGRYEIRADFKRPEQGRLESLIREIAISENELLRHDFDYPVGLHPLTGRVIDKLTGKNIQRLQRDSYVKLTGVIHGEYPIDVWRITEPSENGMFEFSFLPPGEYQLEFRGEYLGSQKRTVYYSGNEPHEELIYVYEGTKQICIYFVYPGTDIRVGRNIRFLGVYDPEGKSLGGPVQNRPLSIFVPETGSFYIRIEPQVTFVREFFAEDNAYYNVQFIDTRRRDDSGKAVTVDELIPVSWSMADSDRLITFEYVTPSVVSFIVKTAGDLKPVRSPDWRVFIYDVDGSQVNRGGETSEYFYRLYVPLLGKYKAVLREIVAGAWVELAETGFEVKDPVKTTKVEIILE